MKKRVSKKLLLVMCFITGLLLFEQIIYAAEGTQQNIPVTINITDANGPLIGATVSIKGTTQGQLSDAKGVVKFNAVSPDATVVVSFIGYATQEIALGGRTSINVVLVEEATMLDELIVTGYGTQRKASQTSSIASISSDEIVATKQNDVITSLQGKIPGLMIRQDGGTAGKFWSNLSVRGYGTPIVVIDGIVRSETYSIPAGYMVSTDLGLAQMNPDDIESITVLKDASASIYGLGAGNGVILITTKKGLVNKPQINYSNTFSFGSPKMPKELGIVELMNISNEMADNSKLARPYTAETIDEYRNGTKTGFSWWDIMMKNFASSQSHNVSIRGGSEKVQYFVSGSYVDENSMYDVDNFTYNRYTLRGNFTAKLTDNLTMDYQVSLRATKSKDPYNTDNYSDASGMLFNYIAYADRTVGATTLANPSHYTYQGQAPTYNPLALADHNLNFTDKRGRLLNNTINLKYDAPFLKGFNMQLTGAYDFNFNGTYNKETKYPLYDYYTDLQAGTGGSRNYYGESISENERFNGRLQANYELKKDRHRITAMLAAEATKTNTRNLASSREFGDFYTHNTVSSGIASTAVATGTRYQTATAGYLGRFNYDYAGKYLVELMGRYDGTYIYASGHRWGFFPSYSLGWRISEEPFIKNNFTWINNLKLRWSDGKTGSTQGGAYAYLSGYTASGSYIFDSGISTTGYANSQIANTILSWADIRMVDLGLDWDFFGGLFGGSFDVFSRKTTGIAGTSSGSTPTILGVTVPSINIDSNQDIGLDVNLTHRNKIGDFNYHVTATGTLSRNKSLHVESQATSRWYSQMEYYGRISLFTGGSRQNRWSNYRALWYFPLGSGQFQSLEEICAYNVKYDASFGGQKTVVGQYKLLDTNDDGYITGADTRYKWGEGNPLLQFGLTIGGDYKNFDFNTTWQGASMVSKIIWLLHIFGYGGYTDTYDMYLDRWHVANAGDDPFNPNTEWISGYWPALVDAAGPGVWRGGTYDAPTDFTQIDGTYFRMKSLEIGYTLPKNALHTIGIESARVFVGGTNLITFCTKKMKYYDPESAAAMHSSTMPIMRTLNFGMNINF
jgi:TonB-linked SusC/RagA family outer membrane protein